MLRNITIAKVTLSCCVLFAAFAALSATPAIAATVTGMNGVIATQYANPFDPLGDGVTSGVEATTITTGAIGGGTISTSSNLDRIVNREDHRSNTGGGRIQSSDGSATRGFIDFQAAVPFTVGTLISAQFVSSGFDAPMAFDIQVGAQNRQSGPGTVDLHPYQVTTFANKLSNIDRLRIKEDMVTFGGSTETIADFQEVLLLPDSLEAIPVTQITATAPVFGSVPGIHDFDGGHGGGGAAGTWAVAPVPAQRSDRFFQLDFGGTETVSALVLANFENIGVDAVILDDTATEIAAFTMDEGSLADFLAIRFDTPVDTSFLRVEFNDTDAIGMREVIALRTVEPFVPEPSTGVLLLIGGSLLASRRRKRRRS